MTEPFPNHAVRRAGLRLSTLSFWLTVAFCLLVVATLVLGWTGWSAQATTTNLTFGDILYRTVSALFIGGPYDRASDWGGDWRLNAARLCGLAVVIVVASKAATVLLAGQWERLKARHQRNHMMLVGDDALIDRIAQVALARGDAVHRFCAPGEPNSRETPGLFVLHGPWDIEQALRFSLARADSVTVSMHSEATTIAVARTIRKRVSEAQVPMRINVRSPWLVRRIGEQEKVIGVGLFSKARLGVRRIQRRHPPFLIAKAHGHARLHIVVVGFGQHGEAVLIETLLSSLVTYLDKPRLTIVDPRARAVVGDMRLRYPELEESIDVVSIEGAVQAAESALTEEELLAIGADEPVTTVYVCLPDESVGLAAGIALQGIALHHGWTTGPIFVRVTTSETIERVPAGVLELTRGQLLGFGETEEVVKEIGVFDREVDALARAFHAGYLAVDAPDGEARVPWKELPEDYRDSNRRLVLHMPAVVSSSGFDIEPWLKRIHERPENPPLPDASEMVSAPSIREDLAALEHERWMADRRINGWRYAEERDNALRLHPDLVSYERLSKVSKEYDRKMILTLAECLEKAAVESRSELEDGPPWWARR